MARKLVLCFDGTNNRFGRENTSIVRIARVIDRNPDLQRLYYDPGVGTLPTPGLYTRPFRKLSELFGLAFGTGLVRNVEEGYAYLMDLWEPGDEVFLFGFSRGAYTARVLAGLLHALGLLPRGNDNLIPYLMRLFRTECKNPPRPNDPYAEQDVVQNFRDTFARAGADGPRGDRRFRVRFLGVFDTVSSVGWVWNQATFPHTVNNPSVQTVRHAVAVDERRWFFRQNLMNEQAGQDFDQQWFPGVHSDVGGGYSERDGGLWRIPFRWVLDAARDAGLAVDAQRLAAVLPPAQQPERSWADGQHESLTPAWWPAEFFPKLSWRSATGRRVPALGLGQRRRIR